MAQIDISTLIEQMQQSAFYPHETVASIELVQTHISYVFLTGDYAYKVKKAVNFGFLDFSTLERRKHFLEEEMRMNKAIASELYLEVLPITQDGDRYSLDGEGEIVEYVLKMRQFPQENLFINLFDAGKLNTKHMEELGKIVAQFHSQAETNDYIRSFGTVAKIREAIDENYQQTDQYIGIAQTQQQFDETKAYTDKFFAEKAELFQARIEHDKIKECHGDLHLKNICLWQDKIQLFDRIEFNEPFRFVDVMYDIAFAVMDLEARDSQDLGNVFLNTYLEQTGDWLGLEVLPIYLSRQAYVRAKVTSFLLNDEAIPDAVKAEATKTAANYYQQAWAYTQQQSGQIILMSGLSGAGKTTVAKQIAKQINAIHIRSDAVRKHLAGIPLQEKGGAEIYSAEMSEQTYSRMLKLGILLANSGFAVVLDAKYDRVALRQPAIAAALDNNIPLKIINCTAPVEILRDRLNKRSGDISDATADLLSRQQAQAEGFTAEEQVYVTTVDTSKPELTLPSSFGAKVASSK